MKITALCLNYPLKSLARKITRILRHEPHYYKLDMDSRGWVYLKDLVRALQKRYPGWDVVFEDVRAVGLDAKYNRIEVQGDKIRAVQGHSVPGVNPLKDSNPQQPPKYLYHGTTKQVWDRYISKQGIKKMGRHHVHLIDNKSYAKNVGFRRLRGYQTKKVVILTIDAGSMYADGFNFFFSNNKRWFVDFVPRQYITDVQLFVKGS